MHNEPGPSARQKRLLIVSYHFPPIVSAGVFRLIGFVRELHKRGWRITVLTVTNSPVERHEAANLELIPRDVTVVRTTSFEIDRLLRYGKRPPNLDSSPEPAASSSLAKPSPKRPGVRRGLRKLLRFPFQAVYRLFTYPDSRAGWILPMVVKLVRLVRENPGVVVLSSSPPHSSQMGVLIARCFIKFRWIADFRDPWTAPSQKRLHPWSLCYQRIWERWVLNRCDMIIANTPGNLAMLREELPSLDQTKVKVITNGFDDVDDTPLPAVAADKLACDLVYVGEVYDGMLGLWVDALLHLKQTGFERIPRLHIFGSVSPSEQARIESAGLEEHIVYKGYVPYRESVAIMRQAPALLVLLEHAPRWKTTVPSKVYAYVFAGRPVLALVPEGDAARILGVSDRSVVITSSKTQDVAAAIADFVISTDRPRNNGTDNKAALRPWSYESLTAQLEAALQHEGS